MLRYASLKMSTNTAVIVDLRYNSKTLRDISYQFIELGKEMIILSFYEALPLKGVRNLVGIPRWVSPGTKLNVHRL